MEVRRVVLSILVVLAVAGTIACCPECPDCPECPPCPETTPKTVGEIPTATQYVVIVPPEDGKRQCRIVPDPRFVEKTQSLTFINLSDVQAKIELPAALTASSSPTLVFFLSKDESKVVLVDTAKSGEYIYSVEGPLGGCLTGLPTPKIIIP